MIPKFFYMILTQFDKKIKQFWSDNASELASIDLFNDKESYINFLMLIDLKNSVIEKKHQ